MKTAKTVDVDKFAELLNIERNIAYGFLRFIADAKLVSTGKRKQPKGKKGKPATLFHLDAGLGERLVAYLAEYLKKIEDVAVVEEAPEAEVTGTDEETPAPTVVQGPTTSSDVQ